MLNTAPDAVGSDVDDADKFWHEAHVNCQLGSPFVTTLCGRVCNWDEMRVESDLPSCVECKAHMFCPICGAKRADPPV